MMKFQSVCLCMIVCAWAGTAGAQEVDPWAKIVDAGRPEGLVVYNVGDYVQDGLVTHFDGIRNAGTTAAHDATATIWKNLVAGAPDAVFSSWPDGNDTSAWVANGYNFVFSRAIMNEPGVALGGECTIQLAVTLDYRDQYVGYDAYPNLFSAPNDFCIYWHNNDGMSKPRTSFYWKTEPYGASDNLNRPHGQWTGGRCVNAILDASKQRLFFDSDPDDGIIRDRTAFEPIPNTLWQIGGGSTLSRSLHGVVHAVRLYNRPLTKTELEHNRRVDDQRFHGDGGNVCLRSALPGAQGTEADGGYDVNGEYTFTTPASVTVGDATYKPAGYQLEVWRDDARIWDFAEVSADTSFTYTNCAARARVRLTWLWEMTGGKKKLDADAYAQYGLVGNFDGIRNDGLNAAHNDAATTWKNLAGSQNAAHIAVSLAGEWERDGYRYEGGDFWRWGDLELGANITIQSVTDAYPGEQNEGGNNFNGSPNVWPTVFGTSSDCFNIYTGGRGTWMNMKCDNVMGGNARCGATWDGMFLTAFVTYARTGMTTGTDVPNFVAASAYKVPTGVRTYYLGGIDVGSSVADRTARCLVGTMHSTRVYTRVITPVEMEWNRFVDRVRFRGLHSVVSTGLVQIAGSAARGTSADDTVYLLRDGTLTVSAPETVECAGATYTCTGYRIETVDPVLNSFLTTARGTDCSYTFTADVASNRRIVWEWQANRLRTAADYTTDDYVQEGLVGNYDGLCNASATAPHNDRMESWRDLSEKKNRMIFKNGTGSNKKAVWADAKAYSFNQDSYGQMRDPLSFNATLTVQQVLDIDIAAQTNAFPNYAVIVNDWGFFTSGTGRTLNWKQDAWATVDPARCRPTIGGWTGKYITAIATGSHTYLTEGVTRGSGKERIAKDKAVGSYAWSIGGAYGNSFNTRASKGLYYATRFYNRPLSDEELAHNRKVDEIRFRGAVVTNVVVASSMEGLHGAETNGVYEVEGEWTFTAAPMEDVSGKEQTVLGYALETWGNGAWGNRTRFSGTSYTYTAGNAPVRLTWRFGQPGMVILVR